MFYKEAPTGESSLADLEEICCQRLQLLKRSLSRAPSVRRFFGGKEEGKSSDEEDEDSRDDYDQPARKALSAVRKRARSRVSELSGLNSYGDGAGHFLLRVALAGKFSRWKAWVYAEAALFADRLSQMNTDEVAELLWSMRDRETSLSFLPTERSGVFLLAWRFRNGDDRESFNAPFQCVPELIASRAVNVSGGSACVKCSYLGQLLQNAFFEGLWCSRRDSQKAYTQGWWWISH